MLTTQKEFVRIKEYGEYSEKYKNKKLKEIAWKMLLTGMFCKFWIKSTFIIFLKWSFQNKKLQFYILLIYLFISGFCSCPPFECVCGYQQTLAASLHQYSSSPVAYQQPQLADSYWPQETIHHPQPYTPDINTSLPQQYDFTGITTELFQPEEIFQIDQSLKPDYVQTSQNTDTARSPSTLLDLGSGTIHREFKTEDYWTLNSMLTNDDSNNSSTSNSRFNLSQSPDSSQLLFNNNLPQTSQHTYLDTKMDEVPFSLQKSQYYHQTNADHTYKHPSFEFVDHKLYPVENNKNFQGFESYQSSKIFPKQPYQEEYIDLAQYNEYNSFLGVYDNSKLSSDSTMLNDLDFRLNACISSMNTVHNYGNENFDVISHQ